MPQRVTEMEEGHFTAHLSSQLPYYNYTPKILNLWGVDYKLEE